MTAVNMAIALSDHYGLRKIVGLEGAHDFIFFVTDTHLAHTFVIPTRCSRLHPYNSRIRS